MNTCSAEWEFISLELKVPENFSEDITKIVFIEVGKDAEYWAGHYGPRFKCEEMGVTHYDPARDISKLLHVIIS